LIQSAKAPWVSLLIIKEGQRADKLVVAPDGISTKVLNGSKCRTPSGLFEEFARVLEFPEYFGHNWDALEECLADLEWLPAKGYLLLIVGAEQVLPRNDEDYSTFLEVLSDAGEAWATGQAGMGSKRPVPFHVLLAISEQQKSRRAHWAVPEITVEPMRRQNKRSTSRRRTSPDKKRS
jgi:hypothetical protein